MDKTVTTKSSQQQRLPHGNKNVENKCREDSKGTSIL